MYLYYKSWEPLHFPAPVDKLQIYELVFDSGGTQQMPMGAPARYTNSDVKKLMDILLSLQA